MPLGVDTCPSKQLTQKKKVIENLKEQNMHSTKKREKKRKA